MKHRGSLIAFGACCVTALVTATTAIGTRAQDNTGADRPTTAPATQTGGATSGRAAPVPSTAGVSAASATQPGNSRAGPGGANASPSTHSGSTHSTHHAAYAKHNTLSASQPASLPAGRDAKGQ
ncbi:hypothetical protein [Paraburkholderia acidisoli]|uniref:Uncharacterized protein n=1 Tax=Paraburkholderia acidisoli TaxID=2571748 RepID=A0A7Z2GGN1_9BURK|nr:hypothetical protein [Paraburkholderia acidisoli]QGZ61472.1 hypothetical protein FAZ98_06840 [Paraburkholderia acidisoli]